MGVCSFDELPQSRSIDRAPGPELHVAHEFPSAFQQAFRIGKLGTPKEPDVDMSRKRVDIGKRRVTNTRGWMAVMQQLSNVVSAVADHGKPVPSHGSQLTRMLVHPGVDRRISPDRAGEPQKLAHDDT